MQVAAHNTYEWLALWEVLEWKQGRVYQAKDTGFHLRRGQAVPPNHIAVSININPGTTIEINPYKAT